MENESTDNWFILLCRIDTELTREDIKKLYSKIGLIYLYGHDELAICEDIYRCGMSKRYTLVSMDGANWRWRNTNNVELSYVQSLLLEILSFPVSVNLEHCFQAQCLCFLLQVSRKTVKAVIGSSGQRLGTKHFKLTHFEEVRFQSFITNRWRIGSTLILENKLEIERRRIPGSTNPTTLKFNYAVFFNYMSLMKQENMNLMRICECIAQIQKSWIYTVLSTCPYSDEE
ncbi:hypothetical protein YC2023_042753 [Brassica napus]